MVSTNKYLIRNLIVVSAGLENSTTSSSNNNTKMNYILQHNIIHIPYFYLLINFNNNFLTSMMMKKKTIRLGMCEILVNMFSPLYGNYVQIFSIGVTK